MLESNRQMWHTMIHFLSRAKMVLALREMWWVHAKVTLYFQWFPHLSRDYLWMNMKQSLLIIMKCLYLTFRKHLSVLFSKRPLMPNHLSYTNVSDNFGMLRQSRFQWWPLHKVPQISSIIYYYMHLDPLHSNTLSPSDDHVYVSRYKGH